MSKQKKANPRGDIATEFEQEQRFVSTEYAREPAIAKPTLLLHSCCGPCSTAVVEALIPEYTITVFFYNPNITDQDEYEKRKQNQIKFIKAYNEKPNHFDKIGFMEGQYEVNRFIEEVKGLEGEPEGGLRCRKCFRLRLEKAAETARLMGFDCFATTLAVSPRKDYNLLSEIGRDLCTRYGVGFLDRDLKKRGGYQRSVELSKQYDLYRQKDCGCEYAKGTK